MIKVKRLVSAGASISGAIREALALNGLTISSFADNHKRNRQNMSAVIAGSRAPTDDDVSALIAELGGTEVEWKALLHEAGRPAATVEV